MGMQGIIQRGYLDRSLGIRVERAAIADALAWTTRFTIAGGPILVTMLAGFRTIIQAAGASTMQFRHSIGNTVLCAATLITGNAVLTMYTITGDPLDNLQIAAAGVPTIIGGISSGPAVGAIVGWGLLMQVGNIQVNFTAGTGSTMYELCYIPLTTASNVIAV